MAQKTKSPKSVNSIIEQCASVLPLHSGIKIWGKSAIFIKMPKLMLVFEIFLKGSSNMPKKLKNEEKSYSTCF